MDSWLLIIIGFGFVWFGFRLLFRSPPVQRWAKRKLIDPVPAPIDRRPLIYPCPAPPVGGRFDARCECGHLYVAHGWLAGSAPEGFTAPGMWHCPMCVLGHR